MESAQPDVNLSLVYIEICKANKMKKTALALILALVFAILPAASAKAFAHREATVSEGISGGGEAGIEPVPTVDPLPTDGPEPTALPLPSIAPRPDQSFEGADAQGFWHSGYHSNEEMTKAEIKALFDSADTEASSPRFEVVPETQNEPYAVGCLTQDNLERTLGYANVMRRLAGLNELVLGDEANMYAQYGAWLLCHNRALSHTPSYDPGIPYEFYQNGYIGCSMGNISKTYSVDGFLKLQIDGYLNEYQSNNVDSVGHRQHFLDPKLADCGFGSAGLYHTMFVGHKSADAQTDGYDFISWPSSGFFPADTEAFTRLSPWSVSFGSSAVKRPAAGDGLTVTVEHNGETVAELVYGSDPDHPSEIFSPTPYITVNCQYTGDVCVIFRPDLTQTGKLEGEYVVTLSNLYTAGSHTPFSVRYRVDFFDLASEGSEGEEPMPPRASGDADGDGEITVLDALMVVRHAMGVALLDGQALGCCDVDGSGTVDMDDSLIILRSALGMLEGPHSGGCGDDGERFYEID